MKRNPHERNDVMFYKEIADEILARPVTDEMDRLLALTMQNLSDHIKNLEIGNDYFNA